MFQVSPVRAEPAPEDPVGSTGSFASPSTEGPRLTWADVTVLVDRHPLHVVGMREVDAAERGVRASSAAPNPVLEGNLGRGVGRADGAARLEWGLSLTVPLGWLAQRGPRVDAASAEVDVARADSAALRRDVLIELGTRFWQLVHAQAQVSALEALAGETSGLVGAVGERVRRGDARPIEATRVELEHERVALQLEVARAELDARRAELGQWLEAPGGALPVADADLEALPPVPDRAAALVAARGSHPAVTVATARLRALETAVRVERAARAPDLAVTGYAAQELDRTAYGGGLAVDLPLWSWNRGRIAQAEARLAAGAGRVEAARRAVESAVVAAQAACAAGVAAASRHATRLLPRAETAVATLERTYQLGEASLLDVIDARRTLLEARREHLAALAEAHIDCARLEALTREGAR